LVRIHLDTDLGSDTDDACALAMLLGWPGVELVGITTAVDPGGRDDIPVAAGAEASLTTLRCPGSIPDDQRYWPATIPPRPRLWALPWTCWSAASSRERQWSQSALTPTWRCWRSPDPVASAGCRWW
jgi:hypothetical protein